MTLSSGVLRRRKWSGIETAADEKCSRRVRLSIDLQSRPSTKVREIAAMLKAIHASEDIVTAREKAVRLIEKLRASRLTRAAELVEAAPKRR
jgi:hypothetical protein